MVGARLDILRAFLLVVALDCAPAHAQQPADPAPTAPEAEAPAAPESATTVSPVGDDAAPTAHGDVAYVQRDGKWVAVPAETLFPELSEDAGNAERRPAPIYVSSLSLDGEVVGDFAEMTAEIGIDVTRDEQWLEVPLGLQQAHVYEFEHDGPGDSVPATGLPPEDGVHWLLKGRGTHTLRCRFRLPIKASPAGSQLQLTLPALPAGFYARAVLRVPDEHAVLRGAAEAAECRIRALEGGMTEFDCDVKGTRWELAWRTAAGDQPTLNQTSYLRIGRTSGELQLQVRQQCDLKQGRLTELLARIPTDFTLRSVDRSQGLRRDRLTWTPVEGRPGWVRVALSQAVEVEGSLELNWEFSRPFPQDGGEVRLDGVELDAAGQQTGTLELEAVEGYTLSPPEPESSGIYQKDTAEPRPGTVAPIVRTFEFQRLPFLLVYRMAPIQPRLSVQQREYLWLEADRMELHVRIDAGIEAGQISELLLDWPGWLAAGWSSQSPSVDVTVDSGMATELVRGVIEAPADEAEPRGIRLRLPRACSGRLQANLTFTRAMADGETNLDLVLPRLSAPVDTRSSSLAVAGALPLEIVVSAESELAAASPRSPLPQGLPSAFANQSEYELGNVAGPIHVAWTVHPRTISAAASITVSEISDRSLRILEELSYEVRHGEIESLLLKVPDALMNDLAVAGTLSTPALDDVGIQFRLADGTVLTPEIANDHVLLRLPNPVQTEVVLRVDFIQALPESGVGHPAELTVPVVRSLDADFATTLLRIEGPDTLQLAGDRSEWRYHDTRSGVPAWSTVRQPNAIQLTLDEALARNPQTLDIDVAFIRTRLDDAGESRTEAVYFVRQPPRRLRIELPESATGIDFAWNDRPLLPGSEARQVAGEPGTFILRLADRATDREPGRLAVNYRQQLSSRLPLLVRTRIEYPRFGEAATVTETLCEIVLPPGQQLSDPPRGLIPEYAWTRHVAVWMRSSTAEYRARRERLGIPPITDRSNVYAFDAYGDVRNVEFGSMAQSLIVLMGAGLTLLLGFIFGRLPATRNVLSVLVLAFLFALLSVWNLELMQLLLQPALLGLLLASVAALFDALARRRRVALRSFDSSLERATNPNGRRSSIHGAGPPAPARTAVYQAEAVPGSGGGT